MSIIVSGIRLPFEQNGAEAIAIALKQCGLAHEATRADIYRRSLDARRGSIHMVYSVCISGIADEKRFAAQPNIRIKSDQIAKPKFGAQKLRHRPIIVGLGPAGLFAAYVLAQHGYQPIVLERGDAIEERDRAVERFFTGGALDIHSNIQFGEGGAGAYSDGKLTTRINDPLCELVLATLVEHGAPTEIQKQAKPHIGTDVLKDVVRAMREHIQKNGGEVRFRAPITGVSVRNGALAAMVVEQQEIACDRAVLAIGHSARDTFEQLLHIVQIEPKAFSVGARIEHAQAEIDRMLYGKHAGHPLLPPAEYTLSHREGDRACYSFCMCPGGRVVAAQSEEHSIATNGMSFHARNDKNANAAIVVSVQPRDFPSNHPLSGVAFQRSIEHAAYRTTQSNLAPCQLVGDFLEGKHTKRLGSVQPTYPMGATPSSIEACLPAFVAEHMRTGLRAFDRKMHGFAAQDAVLTAPETRTSSPIRMTRGETLDSVSLRGLIPCGEGAGYAGGIMSAAVDGIRAAYQIMAEFMPFA